MGLELKFCCISVALFWHSSLTSLQEPITSPSSSGEISGWKETLGGTTIPMTELSKVKVFTALPWISTYFSPRLQICRKVISFSGLTWKTNILQLLLDLKLRRGSSESVCHITLSCVSSSIGVSRYLWSSYLWRNKSGHQHRESCLPKKDRKQREHLQDQR